MLFGLIFFRALSLSNSFLLAWYCNEILLQKIVCYCSTAVETVLKSLDDPRTAGLILEEQANALKSILGDASVLKLVRVRPLFIYLFITLI